jgi:hypothetical protein
MPGRESARSIRTRVASDANPCPRYAGMML